MQHCTNFEDLDNLNVCNCHKDYCEVIDSININKENLYVETSNYFPKFNKNCISCGVCISKCPVGAIKFNENKKIIFDEKKCLGKKFILNLNLKKKIFFF
jgi:ferredoxin